VRLAVTVVTFRRPQSLAVTLAGVLAQDVPENVELDVWVVDNAPERSAERVAEAAGVHYLNEPRPGLARVRNAALDAASDADLLLFVDDDEEPVEGWIDEMVACWRATGATAVAGPLVRPLPEDAEQWVRDSRFFVTAWHPDRAALPSAATSNLLLDMVQVRRLDTRFDLRFGLSGGEDTMFARQLVRKGGAIRWCADGVVVEPQTPERATRAWVLARARRTANSWARAHVALAGNGIARWPAQVVVRLWLTAHATAIAARGVEGATRGAVHRSPTNKARAHVNLAKARGALAGAWGRTVSEYAR
jgi:hypothetical protein